MPRTIFSETPAEQTRYWYGCKFVKELNDLNLIPNLLLSKCYVSRAWKSYHDIRSPIVAHYLQAEIERALEPIKDFSSTTWPTTRNESGDFFFRIEHLCFPLIPLVIPKFLGQLVK